jgi:hypothetical protein
METPIAVAEMRIPVTLGGRERVMRFNANTFVAYEQSTGRFFMDTVTNLYEIMFPKGHETADGKPKPVHISGRDVLRKVSMVDLRAMLWASMHDYDAQGEPVWPDTEAQVGRCLNFHNVVPIFIKFLTGVSANSPSADELGESTGAPKAAAPPRARAKGHASAPISAANGGAGGIELPAGALD